MTDRMTPDGTALPTGHPLRLAYTLNNEQPVRCTYISDEPLFYIDVPVGDLPEDADEGLFLYEEGLLDLLDDVPARPTPSGQAPSVHPEQIFAEQFLGMCKTRPLDETIAALRQSRLAGFLLDFASNQKIIISESYQQNPIFYDRMKGTITLRPDLSDENRKVLLVRELRRVWQHRQGALIHPLLFHPDHAIVINRVQSADLMTAVIRMAWELRLAGDHTVWNMLDTNGYDDLTRAFAREAVTDFRSLNNGRAQIAAFESWFLSERCRAFDRVLIQQMLADYQGYVFRAGHEETSRVLTQQLISALGEMPYGKNYLAAYAATILADPIFTDIRDRSNANFLWFIKFEQSFRATERDLQNEEGIKSSPLQDPASHAADQTATILRLPIRHAASQSVTKAEKGKGGATVVHIKHWRRDLCRS